MTRKRAKVAAGIFSAVIISVALWRYPEAAGIAITAAFALLADLLVNGA